jgi:apolipoprotein N-acyltransferase
MEPESQRSPLLKNIFLICGILISGICWYASCGLTGNFWFLLWAAPVPVLLISFRVSAAKAFMAAFIAFLIGRLSWLGYLFSVVPPLLAITFTMILPLIFAVIIILVRRIVLNSKSWITVFAFPVLWVSFEWLAFMFSRDGTIGSLAYTQVEFLPLVQIASLTGILGISFLVTLIPSAIALAWHRRKDKVAKSRLIVSSVLLVFVAIGFGLFRLQKDSVNSSLPVGLVVIDKKVYENVYDPGFENEMRIARLHVDEIERLASQGAELVVLAEKAIPVTDSSDPFITRLFTDAARKNKVAIVAGYTRIKNGYYQNTALVISPEGHVITDYMKVNLFEGEAYEGFRPGREPGLFSLNGVPAGVAICKDMDFEGYIRKYDKGGLEILYVPAWDFNADGWLHSRMAVMRGVENGYGVVRVAQEGRLTISDNRGRILREEKSQVGKNVVLSGKAPLGKEATIYSQTGDWFAWGNLAAALLFLFNLVGRRKK